MQKLCNPEAELAFVGTMLVHPDELPQYRTRVRVDDICTENARQAYAAICAISDSGAEPSMPLVYERCEGRLTPADIAAISSNGVLPFQVGELAEIITEDAQRRALVQLAKDVALRAYDGFRAGDITTHIDNTLANMRARGNASWITNRDLLAKHIELIEERYKSGGVIGVSTGFPDLDERLGGLVPGNLIMLAAVPKAGKTSCALHMAMHSGVPTLFFTLEMLPEELMDRQLAMQAKVPAYAIRTGKVGLDAWHKIGRAAGPLSELPLSFVWQSGLTVGDIRNISLQYKQQHGLGLIVIDQLDKIHEPAERGENQATRIGRVTTGLKNMARDLGVPVICLTQLLDKQIAQRDVPRPKHGDIRDSSYPDQDADVVLYLWRPSLYWPDEADWRNLVEIIIARSRATAEGSIWVRWEPQYTMFSLLNQDSWPQGVGRKSGGRNRRNEWAQ